MNHAFCTLNRHGFRRRFQKRNPKAEWMHHPVACERGALAPERIDALFCSTFNGHGKTIRKYRKTMEKHGNTIEKHGKTIRKHGKTIRKHGKTIRKHGKTIGKP